MLTRPLPHLPAWRRALRRRRRVLALLVAAAAAVLLLPTFVPTSVRGTAVVVAAQDLPAGTELTPGHLRTVEIASSLVPEGAVGSVDSLAGERLAAPVAEGSALLAEDLLGAEGVPLDEGTALMAVPVPEVLVPHLRAGTRIELLMSDPVDATSTRVPAEVRSLVGSAATGGPVSVDSSPGAQALVLVDRHRSGQVAHALGTSTVTVSVIG